MPGKSESWVQFEILREFGTHPRIRLWRQNTGVAHMGDRAVRFGVPGQADISGLIAPSGRALFIEAKSATGRQSEDQGRFQRVVESMGAIYVLARSVDDVWAALQLAGIGR